MKNNGNSLDKRNRLETAEQPLHCTSNAFAQQ